MDNMDNIPDITYPMLSEVIQGADLAILPAAWRPVIGPHLEALQRAPDCACDWISEDPHTNDSRQLFRLIAENGGPDMRNYTQEDYSDVYNGILATFASSEFKHRLALLPPWPPGCLR